MEIRRYHVISTTTTVYSRHRVKYGLDHFLDHFLDYFSDRFLDYFLDHFLDHFIGGKHIIQYIDCVSHILRRYLTTGRTPSCCQTFDIFLHCGILFNGSVDCEYCSVYNALKDYIWQSNSMLNWVDYKHVRPLSIWVVTQIIPEISWNQMLVSRDGWFGA